MRDVNRIKPLLKQIEELWLKCPDLRLTQLLSNAALSESVWSDNDLYHLEDDKLSDAILKYHLKHYKRVIQ